MLLKSYNRLTKEPLDKMFANWIGLAGLKRLTLLLSFNVYPCTKKAKSFIVTDKPPTLNLNKDKDWFLVGEPV